MTVVTEGVKSGSERGIPAAILSGRGLYQYLLGGLDGRVSSIDEVNRRLQGLRGQIDEETYRAYAEMVAAWL
jgi:hypothetical protein